MLEEDIRVEDEAYGRFRKVRKRSEICAGMKKKELQLDKCVTGNEPLTSGSNYLYFLRYMCYIFNKRRCISLDL